MFRYIRKQYTTLLAIVLAFVISFISSGCIPSKYMAITEETQILDTSNESIALMTLKTSNQYKPKYQPKVSSFYLDYGGKEETRTYVVRVDEPFNTIENQYYEYIVSIQLPPGKYTLYQFQGSSDRYGNIYGQFYIQVFADFELDPNQVIYLGRIEAVNRKRVSDNELRSGLVFPNLIGQAASGFSDGTFDVRIIDNYDRDVARFKETCPVLGTCTIQKRILELRRQR